MAPLCMYIDVPVTVGAEVEVETTRMPLSAMMDFKFVSHDMNNPVVQIT